MAETSDDAELDALLEQFFQEQTLVYELSTTLIGNPVAPLIADWTWYDLQVERLTDPYLILATAQSVVPQVTAFREELAATITTAESRRMNATG